MRLVSPWVCILLLASCGITSAQISTTLPNSNASDSGLLNAHARLESYYVENRGQWDAPARFHLPTPGLDVWLAGNHVVYDLYRYEESSSDTASSIVERETVLPHERPRSNQSGHILRMTFVGASGTTSLHGTGQAAGYYNYFIGDDTTRWASNVPRFESVMVRGLYQGIDAIYHVEQGRSRYDFHLAPGADPRAIRMKFAGGSIPRVDPDNALVIETSVGALRQESLRAYQIIEGEEREVECRFAVRSDGTVGFDLGVYDAAYPLVIDPLVYSTFLSSAGTSDEISAMAIDSARNVYVTGSTRTTTYPTTTGAYQTTFNKLGTTSLNFAFVTKMNPSGSALVFSTFLGGRSSSDYGTAIAIDTAMNIYVSGNTQNSSTTNDFPTTTGAYMTARPTGPSLDGFIAKLNPSGSSLLYSTFFGGSGTDAIASMAVDRSGTAFVGGYTNGTVPTTSGAYQTSNRGNQDAFVARFNASGSTLIYSTFLGGTDYDWCVAIAVDSASNAYITGVASSTNFPTTTGSFNVSASGGKDVFLTRLNSSGSALGYSTYIGGNSDDYPRDITVDPYGNAYVSGYTESTNFPTTTGALRTAFAGGAADAFLVKVNPGGTALTYATYLGGTDRDLAHSVAVDSTGSVYLAGFTYSTGFPTTTSAFDRTHNGVDDVFVLKVNPAGTALLYSTFVGGSADDRVRDLVIDQSGNAYVCGSTASTGFPTTTGAYSTTNTSTAFFVFKLAVPSLYLTSPVGGESWCAGGTHSITWNSSDIDSISIELSSDGGATWQALAAIRFPAAPGSLSGTIPSTTPQGSNYRIRIFDPTNPVLADTGRSFTINRPPAVTVPPTSLTLCPGETATFRVTATGVGQTYQWRKDRNPIPNATAATYTIQSVQASDAGSYDVVVSGLCAPPSTSAAATLTINVPPAITAHPTGGDTICQGNVKVFSVSATGTGLTYQWRKDGSNIPGATGAMYPISSALPQHSGSYDVVVSGTCSPPAVSDTVTLTVIPSPEIVSSPKGVSVCPGEPVTFRASATGAGITYQWRKNGVDMEGETDSSLTLSSVEYSDSGSYDVIVIGDCPLAATSTPAVLVVNHPPAIVTHPAGMAVCPGQPAVLTIAATGAGRTYQWRHKGVPVSGATTATLTLPSVSAADSGSYDVIVSGRCQPPDTSNAAIVSITTATAITITAQPQSRSVCYGDTLALTVEANGASLAYQWRKNGGKITGATSRTLTIRSLISSDTGSYDVVISSPCGQPVTSAGARITIDFPASISLQPRDTAVQTGAQVTFNVGAGGSGLQYQWRKNGTDLPGATTPGYTIPSVSISDTGTYDVVVTGICDPPATSRGAVLKVTGSSGVPGMDDLSDRPEGERMLVVVPHPARGTTHLGIRLPQGLHIDRQAEVVLYDLQGNRVLDLSESFARHSYTGAEFDAGSLPSGMYTCRLVTPEWSRALGIVVIAQ